MISRKMNAAYHLRYYFFILVLFLLPWFVVNAFCLLHLLRWINSYHGVFIVLPLRWMFFQNILYSVVTSGLLSYFYRLTKEEKHELTVSSIDALINTAALSLIITVIFQLGYYIWPFVLQIKHHTLSMQELLGAKLQFIKYYSLAFLPLFLLAGYLSLFRKFIKKSLFDENSETTKTTGKFGASEWATVRELSKINAYNQNNGVFIGIDNNGNSLYLPLTNKLTLSPPGGGKTSASSIPVLLSHPGPVFVFDIRGELWAVAARYRSEVLGRQVVAIDPFCVTKGIDLNSGKSETLLKTHCFNPFDWIPEDKKVRDRVLNALAAAFVINEGKYAKHFDENAKILIRGYIDYVITLSDSERSLSLLYQLMTECNEDAKITFDQMAQQGGRAGAAANQINRVGSDERGSILSTAYRQIDWLGDSNIQDILSNSTFDLRDFLRGNLDIFVILPEDQVKEHNRLVRLLMALLMGMIVQANPGELPQQKILFLLEELAQLGYCPDVEQCIEVLRARGVVVWSVFQTLSQIEIFEKPDLFKGVPLKQIFTNDDTKTMEWIQTLGGKKTVLTKTCSTNRGNSSKKMQLFGGSISRGDSESLHEISVDLIPMNEIREMPKDDQLIFLHGTKPIRCKKVRYFEHTEFDGRYDRNPLEGR